MEKIGAARVRKYLLAQTPHAGCAAFPVRRVEPSCVEEGFFALEEGATALHLHDRNLKVVGSVESRKMSVYEQKGVIQDFAYDPQNELVCLLTSDKKVYFYEAAGRMNLLHIAEKFKKSFTGVWYLKKANLWAAASSDYSLTLWRIHKTGLIFLSVD